MELRIAGLALAFSVTSITAQGVEVHEFNLSAQGIPSVTTQPGGFWPSVAKTDWNLAFWIPGFDTQGGQRNLNAVTFEVDLGQIVAAYVVHNQSSVTQTLIASGPGTTGGYQNPDIETNGASIMGELQLAPGTLTPSHPPARWGRCNGFTGNILTVQPGLFSSHSDWYGAFQVATTNPVAPGYSVGWQSPTLLEFRARAEFWANPGVFSWTYPFLIDQSVSLQGVARITFHYSGPAPIFENLGGGTAIPGGGVIPATSQLLLTGSGNPQSGGTITYDLAHASPQLPGLFVVGFFPSQIALFDGTLILDPVGAVTNGFTANAAGEWTSTVSIPAGLPAGFELFVQCWQVHPAAPSDIASSNGLKVTTL